MQEGIAYLSLFAETPEVKTGFNFYINIYKMKNSNYFFKMKNHIKDII